MANRTQRIPHRAVAISSMNDEGALMLVTDSRHLSTGITSAMQLDEAHRTEAGWLLDYVASRFDALGEGTLVVDRVPIYIWDDGNDTGQLRAFAEQAKIHGWEPGAGIELGKGWITWQKEGRPHVHMAVRRMLEDDPMIPAEDSPETVLERLVRYSSLVGAAYRATPGVSGLAALRNLYDRPRLVHSKKRGGAPVWVQRNQPKWIWNPPEDTVGWGCGDLVWQRNPTNGEREMPYVLAFDVKAMYLAAAAGVQLAFDAPRRTGAIAWDPSLSGFFRIRAAGEKWADPIKGLPIVNPNRIMADGTTWVTGPILAFLDETQKFRPEILDSYTAPGKIFLREWAETLRDSVAPFKTAGDKALRDMVKLTYTESFGMMARAGGRIYRRDWYAAVADEARTRLLRKIRWSTGYTPLKVRTDCVWYPSDDGNTDLFLRNFGQDPEKIKDDGVRIGQFEIKKDQCMPMRVYLEKEKITR